MRIDNVTVRYNEEATVLRELCLEVAPGEILALLGASGCGKSTLLRAISGLQPIASGNIHFADGAPSRRRTDLSFVFQDATLLPWRTVWQNVALPFEIGSQRPDRQREDSIANALETVQLPKSSWRKFPRELSGGMRMRTSIARALVNDPNLLLLDEPFAALDELLRNHLNDLLLDLTAKRPRTVLFVTHNIAEAVYLSHRIVILGQGKVCSIIANNLAWPRTSMLRTESAFADKYAFVSSELERVASLQDVSSGEED